MSYMTYFAEAMTTERNTEAAEFGRGYADRHAASQQRSHRRNRSGKGRMSAALKVRRSSQPRIDS
jgi:hypothetical protein